MQWIALDGESAAIGRIDAEAFIGSSRNERIAMLKPLLEKEENESRDIGAMISFLSELERAVQTRPRENSEGLRAVYCAKKYITDKGALAKPLLEQVALLV